MDIGAFERWLADPSRSQRDKLAMIREQWLEPLASLDESALLAALRMIRRAINSKKLRDARDALLRELRRDGLSGDAPIPRPPEPPPPPTPEVAEATATAPAPDRNPELEAVILADPGARESYLVYGDWLEGRGHPAGQLVAIQHELNKSPGDRKMLRAQQELLEREGERLLGPLADCDDLLVDVEWFMGFIRSCKVSYTLERFNGDRVPDVRVERVLEWLLDDPGPGRFLQHLVVGLVRHDDNNYQGVCDALAARPRPALRSLYLGDFTYEDCELNWSHIGDGSRLWAAVPNLERLTLRSGRMTLGEISLPALRELTTITGGLDTDSARAIAVARWPRLEKLSLQYGPEGTRDFAVIEPILAGEGFPALRYLGLTNCELTDEICAALPRAAILPRLEVLDLSMGTMSNEGAAILAAHRDAFRHLKLLDVDDNYLTDEARPLLEGLCEKVLFGDQRDDGGDPGNRYASAYE